MHVRPLVRDELDALLGLYEHLHAVDEPLPARSVVAAAWERLLATPGLHCLGGFLEDRLISSCTLAILPNLTRGCRPYGLIENVVTHPLYRRKGHGRRVLDHALGEAWAAGCYKVMLMTGRKDAATFSFYESAGFARGAKQAFIAKPEA